MNITKQTLIMFHLGFVGFGIARCDINNSEADLISFELLFIEIPQIEFINRDNSL